MLEEQRDRAGSKNGSDRRGRRRSMIIPLLLMAGTGTTACSSSLDRTLFGPNVPENTVAAQVARKRDYPNVFEETADRPPLLSQEEQKAAKSGLEKNRTSQESR